MGKWAVKRGRGYGGPDYTRNILDNMDYDKPNCEPLSTLSTEPCDDSFQYRDNITCVDCPAGKQTYGGTTCLDAKCVPGNFKWSTTAYTPLTIDSKDCWNCTSGRYDPRQGAGVGTSSSAPYANVHHPNGTFIYNDRLCKSCPSGYWSRAASTHCCLDSQIYGADGECVDCPEGLQGYEVNNTCICYGKTTDSGCVACPEGSTFSVSLNGCLCDGNAIMTDSGCEACPEGSTASGDTCD